MTIALIVGAVILALNVGIGLVAVVHVIRALKDRSYPLAADDAPIERGRRRRGVNLAASQSDSPIRPDEKRDRPTG